LGQFAKIVGKLRSLALPSFTSKLEITLLQQLFDNNTKWNSGDDGDIINGSNGPSCLTCALLKPESTREHPMQSLQTQMSNVLSSSSWTSFTRLHLTLVPSLTQHEPVWKLPHLTQLVIDCYFDPVDYRDNRDRDLYTLPIIDAPFLTSFQLKRFYVAPQNTHNITKSLTPILSLPSLRLLLLPYIDDDALSLLLTVPLTSLSIMQWPSRDVFVQMMTFHEWNLSRLQLGDEEFEDSNNDDNDNDDDGFYNPYRQRQVRSPSMHYDNTSLMHHILQAFPSLMTLHLYGRSPHDYSNLKPNTAHKSKASSLLPSSSHDDGAGSSSSIILKHPCLTNASLSQWYMSAKSMNEWQLPNVMELTLDVDCIEILRFLTNCIVLRRLTILDVHDDIATKLETLTPATLSLAASSSSALGGSEGGISKCMKWTSLECPASILIPLLQFHSAFTIPLSSSSLRHLIVYQYNRSTLKQWLTISSPTPTTAALTTGTVMMAGRCIESLVLIHFDGEDDTKTDNQTDNETRTTLLLDVLHRLPCLRSLRLSGNHSVPFIDSIKNDAILSSRLIRFDH
jgi:hypothetical protein